VSGLDRNLRLALTLGGIALAFYLGYLAYRVLEQGG
jgi:hypothetical protein